MMDPFRVEGPALISFSGGRTSGYMLRRILDAHEGRLPADVHVVFTNTGKEREETLDFVQECSERWGVRVRWIEFLHGPDASEDGSVRKADERARVAAGRFVEVDYHTAARKGEPFDRLLAERVDTSGLPGVMVRYCSEMLKTRTKRNFAWAMGWDEWTDAVGLRADEPRRVAKIRAANAKEAWDVVTPLATEGVAVEDVNAFWAAQPFDLRLAQHEGNCDLCFLKATWKIEKIMRARPDLATWWVEHEARSGKRFALDRPGYADFLWVAQRQETFGFCDLDRDTCECTE